MVKKILIILLFLPISAFGATFYCDCSVSGGTGGTGTYTDPFESIADIKAYEAATGFADGDDIFFLEGSTCDMKSNLPITWEGTGAGNYSILGCYDGEGDFDCDGARPILQRWAGSSRIFFKDNTQYFRIEYLSIKDTNASWQNTGSIGIGTKSDGSPGGNGDEGYITITDCVFTHFGFKAIRLAQVGSNIIITDNECADGNGNCIYLVDETADGASYGYVANNTCGELVGYKGTDGHCVGLQSTDYFIVENNISTDAYNGAFVLGRYGPTDVTHNVFRNNISNGNRQSGVLLIEGDGYGNLVYSNIIIKSGNDTSDRPGLRIDDFNDSRGNYFFNNTVYDAGYGGIGIRSSTLDAGGRVIDYITYINNIVVVDGVTLNENELVWVEEHGTNNANMTVDYNIFWTIPNTDPSGYALWKAPDDATTMTWANWKTDGWGGNDIVDNPDFVDTTDFELQAGSPAVDAGRFLTNVTSANGSGTIVNVANTYILHDDMGLVDEDGNAVDGMLISFYDTTNGRQDREITGITHGTSISLDSAASWIYNGSYPGDTAHTTQIALRFQGTAPDIGAKEFKLSKHAPAQN